jgi:hypothetical protein
MKEISKEKYPLHICGLEVQIKQGAKGYHSSSTTCAEFKKIECFRRKLNELTTAQDIPPSYCMNNARLLVWCWA